LKRFTETEKWRDIWFRNLPPDLKLAWQYICDNCDNAGVWDPDFALADFQIGLNVDWEKAKLQLADRVKILESGKWHLVGFIAFQQKELSPHKASHKQIISLCHKHGIDIPYVKDTDGMPMPTGNSHSHSKGHSHSKKGVQGEVEAKEVLEYLNQKSGKKFQPVNGSLHFIKARLSEGATIDQCRGVIDLKCSAWLRDAKMKDYLRPQTLFNAEKFAAYVGEIGAAIPKQNLADEWATFAGDKK
jgi:uncharacterized phage protein (TIGR02220 family)